MIVKHQQYRPNILSRYVLDQLPLWKPQPDLCIPEIPCTHRQDFDPRHRRVSGAPGVSHTLSPPGAPISAGDLSHLGISITLTTSLLGLMFLRWAISLHQGQEQAVADFSQHWAMQTWYKLCPQLDRHQVSEIIQKHKAKTLQWVKLSKGPQILEGNMTKQVSLPDVPKKAGRLAAAKACKLFPFQDLSPVIC